MSMLSAALSENPFGSQPNEAYGTSGSNRSGAVTAGGPGFLAVATVRSG